MQKYHRAPCSIRATHSNRRVWQKYPHPLRFSCLPFSRLLCFSPSHTASLPSNGYREIANRIEPAYPNRNSSRFSDYHQCSLFARNFFEIQNTQPNPSVNPNPPFSNFPSYSSSLLLALVRMNIQRAMGDSIGNGHS